MQLARTPRVVGRWMAHLRAAGQQLFVERIRIVVPIHTQPPAYPWSPADKKMLQPPRVTEANEFPSSSHQFNLKPRTPV
jgi:hypothetical protein